MPETDTKPLKRVKPRHTGQGRVKDPQKDGRLRENREAGIRKTKPAAGK